MTPHRPRLLYKILGAAEWQGFRVAGLFDGSEVDRRDGFIHFSYADQLAETARKHFSGRLDLVLLAVDPAPLGAALRDEVSRGGALFPHLYAPLPLAAVLWDKPIPLDPVGRPVLPSLDAPD
ncbi:MAG: DUF952 domain-containing protein [Hyphomicrobiales bacterium]|uniref:DUF952 domain-containing protein n=1 Tax=Rhabdaerophilum calidifontis TaxID=2604328 RepID=UPI00123BF548|nr:DUF952 domain-containing protein [Rhabdaerophilum calidifontis]MCA1953310.1 DUF952 domain-containing protein [Hyphomicrobiales bacterium]MCA2000130.1 DUF952 domain-containing protein [Hyphomicrobiales bacterium]